MIIVSSAGNDSILTFFYDDNGNDFPYRKIEGLNTGLDSPAGLALDNAENLIYTSNLDNSSITAYSKTANGNIAPLKVIDGALTNLDSPMGIAFSR